MIGVSTKIYRETGEHESFGSLPNEIIAVRAFKAENTAKRRTCACSFENEDLVTNDTVGKTRKFSSWVNSYEAYTCNHFQRISAVPQDSEFLKAPEYVHGNEAVEL